MRKLQPRGHKSKANSSLWHDGGITGGMGLLLSLPFSLWKGVGGDSHTLPPLFWWGENKGTGKGKTKKYQTPILPTLQIRFLPSLPSFQSENKRIF